MMQNLVYGRIGGRNASPSVAIGMPVACTRKAATSINTMLKNMDTLQNSGLRTLSMNGKPKTGTRKNWLGFIKKPGRNILLL